MDFEDPDEDMIIDAKGNWTIFQFNRVKAKPIKPLYHWQLDTYMWLWNKSKARLVYGLVNTPQKLIEMEKKKLLYTFTGTDEEYNQACEEIQYLHTYDDIPLERKIKTFDIKRDDTRIDMLKQTINDCRYYLNNFEQANTFDEDKTNEDETED